VKRVGRQLVGGYMLGVARLYRGRYLTLNEFLLGRG